MCDLPTEILKKGKPTILSLKLNEKDFSGCKAFELGTARDTHVEHKKILVLGETGVGKTSFLNTLTNYVLGVKFDDDKRYVLVNEKTGKDQSESQTEELTAYTLHHQPGFKVDFTLTIVDTPGFADTRGMEQDKKTCELIHKFFMAKDAFQDINAVMFLSSAGGRLTEERKYVLRSVLSFFGKNLEENIILVVTNATENKPDCLSALRASNVPYNAYFKVDNAAVLTQEDDFKEEEDDGMTFKKRQWDLTWKNLKKLTDWLCSHEPKSLHETRIVTDTKEQINNLVVRFHEKLKLVEEKLADLKSQEELIAANESRIKNNEDFEYFEKVSTYILKPNVPGVVTTKCTKCSSNCHYPCAPGAIFPCIVFRWYLLSFTCTICGCERADHEVECEDHFEVEQKQVKRTYTKLKKEYEKKHTNRIIGFKEVLELKRKEYEDAMKEKQAIIEGLEKAKKTISEFSLSPSRVLEMTATFFNLKLLASLVKKD